MSKILPALFFLIFLLPSVAYAGINIEQVREDTKQEDLFGDVEFSGNVQYGNTNILNVSSAGLLGYHRNKSTIFVLGSASFATDFKQSLSNSQMGHVRYNYQFFDWLWWEFYTQVAHDEFLLVNLRVLGGQGPRFALYNGKVFQSFFGTSYMPEYEMLDANSVSTNIPNTFVHRWSNYLSFVFSPTEALKVQNTTYAQPRLDKFSDFRIMNDSILSVELNNTDLELDVGVKLRYDSLPPELCDEECKKLKSLDITSFIGLSFEF